MQLAHPSSSIGLLLPDVLVDFDASGSNLVIVWYVVLTMLLSVL